jgi:thiol-disulfide isomerase/thioredoxin
MKALVAFAACAPLLWGCATPAKHGEISALSTPKGETLQLCEHKVPAEVCVRCNPALIPEFRRVNDWCGEHDRPESQCLICHPKMTFEPLPKLPPDADLKWLSTMGEDIGELDPHVVPGKVTVFDFVANWCVACREIERHLYTILQKRSDLAVRKLHVVTWEDPIVKRYLMKVAALPYVVVYGKDGKRVTAISGVKLEALDKAVEEAAKR